MVRNFGNRTNDALSGRGRGSRFGNSGAIIRQGGGGRGFVRGRGTFWRGTLRPNVRASSQSIAKSFSRTKGTVLQHDLFQDSLLAAGIDVGAKLYISNLHYGVTNEDIKELFSELGDIKHFAVHYDRSGRSIGTAEVIYLKRSDAIAAMKRYNNVSLDGKPMKIELIGIDTGAAVSARVNVTGGPTGRRTVVMVPELGPSGGVFKATNRGARSIRGGFRGRGRGRGDTGGRGRGRGRYTGGRGIRRQQDKSADQLDKELEEYHAEAMQT